MKTRYHVLIWLSIFLLIINASAIQKTNIWEMIAFNCNNKSNHIKLIFLILFTKCHYLKNCITAKNILL